MMGRKSYWRGKVPKELFSEKFRALPPTQKMAVRRVLATKSLELHERIQKLAGSITTIGGLVYSEKRSDLVKANKFLTARFKERQAWKAEFDEHCSYAKEYFDKFEASHGGRSILNNNPFERRAHEGFRLLGHFDTYYQNYRNIVSRRLQ